MPTTLAGGEVPRSQGKQFVWALALVGEGPKATEEGPEYCKRLRPKTVASPKPSFHQGSNLPLSVAANFETPVSGVVFWLLLMEPFPGLLKKNAFNMLSCDSSASMASCASQITLRTF